MTNTNVLRTIKRFFTQEKQQQLVNIQTRHETASNCRFGCGIFTGVNISLENHNFSPRDQKVFPLPNIEKEVFLFYKNYKHLPNSIFSLLLCNFQPSLKLFCQYSPEIYNFCLFDLNFYKSTQKHFPKMSIFKNCSPSSQGAKRKIFPPAMNQRKF